jgi:signal transduction histidine kinase
VNLATLVSLTSCFIGLLHALATRIVSSAPHTRGLRVFSVSCVLGALYAACNATLSVNSFAVSRIGVQFGLLFVGLHGVSWYVYTAQRDGRALYRWERFIIAGGAFIALVSVIPNLFYRTDENWIHGVPWLGIRYIDARSTPLGDVAFMYYAFAMSILLVRALWRAPRAGSAERTEALGLTILYACGVNDALVVSDTIASPYLLDFGFLALVVLAGAGLSLRYVENARVLASTQEELISRERLAALGEMSAVVAHEVRNPVAIIFNAAASLRKMPEERDKLLVIIEEEAERLKRMASNLLDFARPMSTHMMDAPLGDIVESALDALQKDGAGGAEVDVARDLPAVHGDVRLLRQAILNLVANAVEAPGRKEHVRVRAEVRPDERVHIEVIDDGQGVPEAIRANISRPFFTTRPTGTGLGLAIVRRIVESHGGKLEYKETHGGGATFAIDVPASEASGPRPGAGSPLHD